jgi:hypothetical protein
LGGVSLSRKEPEDTSQQTRYSLEIFELFVQRNISSRSTPQLWGAVTCHHFPIASTIPGERTGGVSAPEGMAPITTLSQKIISADSVFARN